MNEEWLQQIIDCVTIQPEIGIYAHILASTNRPKIEIEDKRCVHKDKGQLDYFESMVMASSICNEAFSSSPSNDSVSPVRGQNKFFLQFLDVKPGNDASLIKDIPIGVSRLIHLCTQCSSMA